MTLIAPRVGFLVLAFALASVNFFSQNDDVPLKFKNRIGFTNSEDIILAQYFFDDDKKLLLVGGKTMQIWNVEDGLLLHSFPHNIAMLAPKKAGIGDYLLLGLPVLVNDLKKELYAKDMQIDPNGKWIASVEKVNGNGLESVIVRDLDSAKQVAKLDVPGISIGTVEFDAGKNEIVGLGQTDKTAAFANWDPSTFALKRLIKIERYKWHQLFRNEGKMIVVSNDVETTKADGKVETGDRLTLRDVKTGAIERQFTANGLDPGTSFKNMNISSDEKYIVAEMGDRIFVWEIDGSGQPRFEISSTDPKEPIKFKNVIGGRLIAVSRDKDLLIYDIAGDGKPKYEISSAPPKNTVSVAAISKDGEYFAVHQDEKTTLYKTDGDGKPVFEKTRESEKDRLYPAFMDDEKQFLVTYTHKTTGKGSNTLFYDIENNKVLFDIPQWLSRPRYIQQKKLLYSGMLDETFIWNFAENKSIVIPLKEEHNTCSSGEVGCSDEWYPLEFTTLSPDEKYVLKYGSYDTSLFDVETGKQIQTIFDLDKVKYDKHNKVKKSGLGSAGWTKDGRFVYALNGDNRTVMFWTAGR